MNRPYFVDTVFYIGVLNEHDEIADRLSPWLSDQSLRFVTTDLVLIEVANYFAVSSARKQLARFIHKLHSASNTKVIHGYATLIREGLALYNARPDKHWSLTDCTSFVIMKRLRIREALTADRHFVQAGFKALLK